MLTSSYIALECNIGARPSFADNSTSLWSMSSIAQSTSRTSSVLFENLFLALSILSLINFSFTSKAFRIDGALRRNQAMTGCGNFNVVSRLAVSVNIESTTAGYSASWIRISLSTSLETSSFSSDDRT